MNTNFLNTYVLCSTTAEYIAADNAYRSEGFEVGKAHGETSKYKTVGYVRCSEFGKISFSSDFKWLSEEFIPDFKEKNTEVFVVGGKLSFDKNKLKQTKSEPKKNETIVKYKQDGDIIEIVGFENVRSYKSLPKKYLEDFPLYFKEGNSIIVYKAKNQYEFLRTGNCFKSTYFSDIIETMKKAGDRFIQIAKDKEEAERLEREKIHSISI